MSFPALPRRSGDLLFGGHAVLAVSMALWRALESVPGLSSETGGSFASSTAGRLAAFATLLASGLAGFAVLLQSARLRRDPRVLLLAALLVAALATRKRADVFDLVYAGAALAFAAWWWKSERARAQASA